MRFKLGYAYFSKRQFDNAKKMFDRIKNQRHQYASGASYYAGYIAFQQENYDAAYHDFLRIKDDKTYKKIVVPNILKILYKQEKYDQVISFVEDNNIKSSEANLYLGESYFFKNDFDNAKRFYDKYFAKSKRAADEVMYRYGYTLLKSKKYAEASEYFKKSALGDDELGQNSAFNLGICYLNTSKKDYALGAFLHASELDFDKKIQEEALVSYAKLNYENKNYNEAIRTLKKLNETYPNSTHFKENEELLTDALVNSSDYEQAVNYLDKISNKSYREKKAYQKATYNLAVKKYNTKNYEPALSYFEKSLKYPIDKKLVLASSFWMAETYAKGGKYDESITYYARVFENDPLKTSDYYLKSRYGIAYSYYNTKKYDKATNHYKYYVLNANPKASKEKLYEIDATTRLADCYYVQKDYGRAINEYRQVKSQRSLHFDYASFQLGVLEYLADRTDEAKDDLEDIINNQKTSPYYDDALYQRALIDLETGAYASAVAGFSDLIDYKPNNKLVPMAYAKRAIAYGNLSKNEKELNDYLFVLDNHITHPIAYTVIQSLPSALAKLGKEEQFEIYLDKYKKANPMADDLSSVEFESAKTLYFNQRFEAAINSFEKFISTYPNTVQSYEGEYLLAESYRKTNQFEKAAKNYELVIANNQSDYVLRSIYKVAEIYFESSNYAKAIEKYTQLEQRGESGSDKVKAFRGLMKSYFNNKDCENSSIYADKLISSGFANENQIDEAKLYVSKCKIEQNSLADANEKLKQIVENNSNEIGAEANYLYALNRYNSGDYDHSIEICQALNKSYAGYDLWVSKSFLLIAKNLIAKEEDFQAKATLNSIIEYSKVDEVVSEAKELLIVLENKVEEEKSIADTTEVIEIDTTSNE